MKELLHLFPPFSLRVRSPSVMITIVLVFSFVHGIVTLIGYSVSFGKTTFRLSCGESNLLYTLVKQENSKLHVELPENIDK